MASALVADELSKDPKVGVKIINPGEMDLRMPGAAEETEDSKKLKQAVHDATAVVLATPEYHGSFSSLMKLTIENLGFPSALAGKPVVTYDIDGNREALIEGETGFAVPAFDRAKLAEKVELLAGDAALRGKMGARGREFALSRFDVDVMIQGLEEVYQHGKLSGDRPASG